MYKFGLFIGRMQPIHCLHEHIINKGLAQCEKLLVLVGSSQIGEKEKLEELTVRNPFPANLRIKLVEEIYKKEIDGGRMIVAGIPDMTDENDICHEWGDYLLHHVNQWSWWFYLDALKLDYMVYGADENREGWFNPKSIEGVHMEKIERIDGTISATQLRKYISENDYHLWEKHVNPKIHKYFPVLQGYLTFATDNEYRNGTRKND